MLEKNLLVRDTIRMFLSEIQRYEIDTKETADDAKALQIINKMIKQKDSLIVSLKDTVTNLSNIIITSGQNLVKVNDSITSNIDASFLDHYKKINSISTL